MPGGTRGPTPCLGAAKGGPHLDMVWPPWCPSSTPLRTRGTSRKNRDFCLRGVQFREYFQNNFSETKNSRKQGTGTGASCNIPSMKIPNLHLF